MATGLSVELRNYLMLCGLSQRRIEQCTVDTRMYHDLGLYGDEAEAFMEELEKRGVDLSCFEFYEFFPPEFEGRNMLTATLLSMVPLAAFLLRRRREYMPLTLGMLEKALDSKKF